MGTRSVAIDIGATVRVAEVELANGADPREGATLHAYSQKSVPPGVIRDGAIEEPAALSSIIRQAISEAKPSSKRVIVGLGQPSVVVREIDVPAQPMDKVRESLALNAQDQLPMAPEDAVLDFYPTSEFMAPAGPTLRGLLVASSRELVREIVSVLDAAGVRVTGIDHSALGLWRGGCRGAFMEHTIAFVDVGASRTLLTVSRRGAPTLIRVLPQSSSDANRAIANALKGQTADVEALKREYGMDTNTSGNGKIVADAAAHALIPLVEAIRNTLVYVSSSNPGSGVDRVVLTGGGAYVRGFGQALSSSTRLPVSIGDPLASMRIGRKVDRLSLQGREAELATVVGLAMGGQK